MSKIVVSELRAGPLAVIIGLSGVLGVSVLYSDVTGTGLRSTIFYHALGYATYPVFYGAILISLWQFISMFSTRNAYLSVDGQMVIIGRKTISAGDISRIILRASTVSELVFQRRNGSDIVIKAWMLSRPANDVLAHLHSVVFKPRSVTG